MLGQPEDGRTAILTGVAADSLKHADPDTRVHLAILVEDSRLGESFMLLARPDNAHDVFTHPYAYAQPLAA